MFEDRRDVTHRRQDVVVSQQDDGRLVRNRFQGDFRFGDDCQRALAACQQSSDVDLSPVVDVFDESVEVVARDVALEVGVAGLDFVRMLVENRRDLGVNSAFEVVGSRKVVEVIHVDPAKLRHRSVGEYRLDGLDVAVRLVVFQRVCAGRVVADTATEHALVAPRGVGGVFQSMLFEMAVESCEGDPRLCAGPARVRIHREHPVHVALEVQYDRLVDGLSGEAGPATTR